MEDDSNKRFEQLFERYERPIWSFFAKRGYASEACHDLTQETLLGVYKGMDRFRRESSIDTWVFTIAANVWRNELRNRAAQKRDAQVVSFERIRETGSDVLLERQAHNPPDPLREVLAIERVELVREALGTLPPKMRQCFLLRFAQEMKYSEIAVSMRTSINTVKSQISQARERLKESLDEFETSRAKSLERETKEA